MFFQKKKHIFYILAILAILSFSGDTSYCRNEAYWDNFFSYQRFKPATYVIARISYDNPSGRALQKFSRYFIAGMNAISNGKLEEARQMLLSASKEWPEYYGTDFILALLNEEMGEIETASRFYKTYLYKLDKLQAGEYRISEKIILSLSDGKLEEYDYAADLVRARLGGYGIDLDRVMPAIVIPPFLFYFILIMIIAAVYLAIVKCYVPYIKKVRLIKNPPEGFWVCKYCETEVPSLIGVCTECRRPKAQ